MNLKKRSSLNGDKEKTHYAFEAINWDAKRCGWSAIKIWGFKVDDWYYNYDYISRNKEGEILIHLEY